MGKNPHGTDEAPSPIFTADNVLALLRKAGAPEPFVCPDQCSDTANTMMIWADVQRGEESWLQTTRPHVDALKAARTLQKILPDMIAQKISTLLSPSPAVALYSMGGAREAADEALNMIALEKALDSVFPEAARYPSTPPIKNMFGWHGPARILFNDYRKIVGSGAPTKHGPAARFITLSLAEMGCVGTGGREITCGSVEQALRAYPSLEATLRGNRM